MDTLITYHTTAVLILLFIAYPPTSAAIIRLYLCEHVDGIYYLIADQRLTCYDSRWNQYAAIGAAAAAVYIIGIPALFWGILNRNRDDLYLDEERTLAEETQLKNEIERLASSRWLHEAALDRLNAKLQAGPVMRYL